MNIFESAIGVDLVERINNAIPQVIKAMQERNNLLRDIRTELQRANDIAEGKTAASTTTGTEGTET